MPPLPKGNPGYGPPNNNGDLILLSKILERGGQLLIKLVPIFLQHEVIEEEPKVDLEAQEQKKDEEKAEKFGWIKGVLVRSINHGYVNTAKKVSSPPLTEIIIFKLFVIS